MWEVAPHREVTQGILSQNAMQTAREEVMRMTENIKADIREEVTAATKKDIIGYVQEEEGKKKKEEKSGDI